MMAKGFEFNSIYVVESLMNERKTGKELYDDLLRWKEMQIKELTCHLFQPTSKSEFLQNLETILKDTKTNGVYPILHIEAHGNRTGLELASGEFILWTELYDYFVEINKQSRFNLFLTLAICKGAYFMEEIKSNRPAPLWGFIGSFDNIYNEDIIIRYTEFYTKFLTTFNLNCAFETLLNANPDRKADYRFISAQTTFIKVYKEYVDTKFSEVAIKERFKSTMKEIEKVYNDQNEKNRDYVKFKSLLIRTKHQYMEEHRDIFYMVDTFPENRERFNLSEWQPFS